MPRPAGLAVLLLVTGVASAAAVTFKNTTATKTTSAKTAEDYDEEGYRYGGKFVPNFSSEPFKGKFVQFPFTTCPAPYDTFSFVTKIRVCRDKHGFITGLKYFSEHPIRHHDPTSVCDVTGHEGAADCETLKLYTEDWKWRRYRTVTNIRTSKVKDGRDHWRVVYIAFSYSEGTGVEFGSYPHQPHAKHEQWFIKPEPGKICGLNGVFSMSTVCDSHSGYLQWVKPCGKCIPKPKNYKCDADYCTRKIKHSYKGGYKGDFNGEDLYKDDEDSEKYETKYDQQYKPQYEEQRYEHGQYDKSDDVYQQGKARPQPQPLQQKVISKEVPSVLQPTPHASQQAPQPLQQQQPQQQLPPMQQQQQPQQQQQQQQPAVQQPQQPQQPASRHEHREQHHQERLERRQERLEKMQQVQEDKQQQQLLKDLETPGQGTKGWLGLLPPLPKLSLPGLGKLG